MAKAKKKSATADARAPARLHRAFVTAPRNPSGLDEEDDPRAALLRLARSLGVPRREALRSAVWNEWYIEREANYARAWAAKQHPGAPLDLEGFAAFIADGLYSHLARREGLAWGRTMWFRALAPVAHWDAARIVAESRRTRTREAA